MSAVLWPLALALLAGAPQEPEPPQGEPPAEVPADAPPVPAPAPAPEEPIVIELLAPEAAPGPAATGAAPRLDLSRPRTPDEVAGALATLAERYPALLRVESLGTSGAGRALPLAVIGAGGGAPALLLGDHFESGGGPERRDVALELIEALLHRAGTDAELRALLRRTTLYVVPVLAADERAASLAGGSGAAAATRVRFDQNFPSGWQPDGIRPRSGPYPLSLPEARALHTFLLRHPHVAIAVGIGTLAEPSLTRDPLPAGPAEPGRALLERVWVRAVPGTRAAHAGASHGGWLDTCREGLGIDTLTVWPGARSDASGPAADGLAAGALDARGGEATGGEANGGEANGGGASALVPGVAALLASLPRLELGAPKVSPLTPGMWQVDVTLANPGRLSTHGELAPRGVVAGDVGVDLVGGQLVAAAYRAPDASGFSVLGRVAAGRLGIGELRGGEAGVLRLVLEAQPGVELTLATRAPRAGSAQVPILLP